MQQKPTKKQVPTQHQKRPLTAKGKKNRHQSYAASRLQEGHKKRS